MDKFSKPNSRNLRLTNKTILSSHSLDVEKQYLNLLHLASVEAAKIGLSEFARRLQIDVSNLSKGTDGKRKLSRQLAARFERYFEGRG
jgi:plasmid maintenance system antidote protein VapI